MGRSVFCVGRSEVISGRSSFSIGRDEVIVGRSRVSICRGEVSIESGGQFEVCSRMGDVKQFERVVFPGYVALRPK